MRIRLGKGWRRRRRGGGGRGEIPGKKLFKCCFWRQHIQRKQNWFLPWLIKTTKQNKINHFCVGLTLAFVPRVFLQVLFGFPPFTKTNNFLLPWDLESEGHRFVLWNTVTCKPCEIKQILFWNNLTLHSYTAVQPYMVHSLVPPYHRHKHDGINWLGHTTQTRLAVACTKTYVDWPKFPEHNTTPCRGSPMSYRSMYPAHLAPHPWYSAHIGRHIPHNRSLQF